MVLTALKMVSEIVTFIFHGYFNSSIAQIFSIELMIELMIEFHSLIISDIRPIILFYSLTKFCLLVLEDPFTF